MIDNNRKESILFRAEKILYYNELLLEQCDSWLSEEEGVKNVEKSVRHKTVRHKTQKQLKIKN
jgi:hypothetical protein